MIKIYLFSKHGLMETKTCDDMGDVESLIKSIPQEIKNRMTFLFITFKA